MVILFLLIVNFLIGEVLENVLMNLKNELAPFYFNLARIIINGLILLIITIIFDYTKIDIVFSEQTSIPNAIKRAISFFNANHLQASILFGTIFFFGLIVIMFSWILSDIFPTSGNILIILLFLFQQLIVFLRFGIKLMFYASQFVFFRNRMPILPNNGLWVKNQFCLEMTSEMSILYGCLEP